MNRPCRIHFHEDSSPNLRSIPEEYHSNLEKTTSAGISRLSLLAQNAFYIDFAPNILRTRIGGTKEEDPIDFPVESITHIEWFYGDKVPEPLTPWTQLPRRLPKDVTMVEVD